jgi:pSer/pThr/pTyr-binding forkhead associated (FHA) protein
MRTHGMKRHWHNDRRLTMASLIVASGARRGESFWLGERANIIGTGQWTSMRIVDASVSQEHVRITYDPAVQGHCLCPMDPGNPVYVNGRQITSQRRLFEEDRVLVGNTVLVFTQNDLGTQKQGTPPPPAAQADAHPERSEREEDQESEVCGWMPVLEGSVMTFVRWFGDRAALRSGPAAAGPGRPIPMLAAC